ncbi:MAG: exosortase F system-associated protein [Flavobacteriaceae bacterium]|nr:exosortase F system-associated protein [Flavobacteriaceae bacterium]
MNKLLKLTGIVFLFGLLILVRLFEADLFYDPLLTFFKQDYLHSKVPDVEFGKLMLHTAFRFGINTLISLLILYVAFKDKGIVKFSSVLYLIAFVILFSWMAWLVANASPESNYNILFYVRRFLIQPLFVLLFLPAFYYHKQKTN